MVRLLILVVLLFLIWLLFVSKFTQPRKIIIAVAALLVGGVAIWFEGYGENPKEGIVALEEVVICGVESVHSYRTNFNVSVCLENKSQQGTIQRVSISVLAERCETDASCVAIENVQRDVLFVLAPGAKQTLKQSLGFDKVDSAEDTRWSATVERVLATR